MAKSQKKATRKFEKKHLKDALEHRKTVAKFKQRQQVKAKRKARNANDAEFNDRKKGDDSVSKLPGDGVSKNKDKFAEMTVDDFFQGGFKLPEKKSSKSKPVQEKLRKRKRVEMEKSESAPSEASFEDSAIPSVSDPESESEQVDKEHGGMSKNVMQQLAVKDPEFYNFLKENDPETLDFDENADDLAEADLSSSDSGEMPKIKRSRKGQDAKPTTPDVDAGSESEVTKAMVFKWKKAMTEEHSLRAMREVVLAFKAAAHANEEDFKGYKYIISNADVYHELLTTALQEVSSVLGYHIPVKEKANGRVQVATDEKKFKKITILLKSYISSIQHLLTHLSDEPTLKLTLSAVTPLLPYLLSFKKLLKNVIKTITDIWSDSSNTEVTRITAFLVLRRLVVIGDAGLREAVLKTVYQGLVQGSRNTNVHTIQGINLMKNSATELWGIDQNVGYTTGFASIRQLAIHLRQSLTHNSNESYKTVYNWQYVHSLDFWSCVLSEHCNSLKEAESGKESDLRPLIYPTVQITLGAMRLIPTATYFPLRFQLIRSLLRLSRSTGTYIPLASALFEVLDSNEMKSPPKPSTLKSFDFSINYKAPKSYLRTRIYQDGLGEQVTELFGEFFTLWCTSIAFPELALAVIVMLKRWLKQASNKNTGNKNGKINAPFALLVQKLEANARWIEDHRAKVDFAPNNREGVEAFLKGFDWEKTPLGAFVAMQRKQRENDARLLETARRDDDRKERGRDKYAHTEMDEVEDATDSDPGMDFDDDE